MSNPTAPRQPELTPAPSRTDTYRETVVDATDTPETTTTRNVYQEQASGPAGVHVVRSERVTVPSDATRRGTGVTRFKQVIYFIFGAVNVLLLTRFLLLLLGANEGSAFVSLIYDMSRVLVLPFRGIFAEPALGSSVFDLAALVGIAVYSLVAYGLVRLIEVIYAPVRPTVTGN